MGRYYNGYIEGKFWFAVQNSNCADRFGSIGIYGGEMIFYEFEEKHLVRVEEEIKKIQESLSHKLDTIENLSIDGMWTVAELNKAGVTSDDVSDYADLLIGIKIRDCIKEKRKCYFDAEL
jgi:hypothetical protein